MTAWRLSVDHRDGVLDDLVAEVAEGATVGDLLNELSLRGYLTEGWRADGQELVVDETLAASPIGHGSVLRRGPGPPRPSPGWYLVSIAGPDTGAWSEVGAAPISVGRSLTSSLIVADSSLSAHHFQARLEPDGVEIRDLGSTNGTVVEGGKPISEPTLVSDGAYLHAGATTFGVVRIWPDDIPNHPAKFGPTIPFQRRFRGKLEALPKTLRHPTEKTERSEANRRPIIGLLIPIITAVGMAAMTGRYIFLLVIALGPVFYAVDGIRRRRIEAREAAQARATYDDERARFTDQLLAARREELRRDRWQGAPAGLAALLASSRHERLWERGPQDGDFCEVAIGLVDRSSSIEIESRPAGIALPMDKHWSAVLRHSLVQHGPLAIRGAKQRARAIGRSILLDLATSHSPNDVKIWLLTEEDSGTDWNPVRWLPHSFLGDSQGRVFATPHGRATALSTLRSIINERSRQDTSDGQFQPIHVVLIDCLGAIEPRDITDLLVDGANVGVVGITLDAALTPEGCRAELSLGLFSDQAEFDSHSQEASRMIRSFEMNADRFESSARVMAGCRPAGSSREGVDTSGVIRLVDLIAAPTEHGQLPDIVERWRTQGGTSRVRVGGLGDLITDIDIMRDGPHGLVGGTTRSGKTEFLKSLITSLAVANHPDDLSIVIVDFKGGVDHQLSSRLHHVIDLSTNHDAESFVRTIRLIEAEMQRRQHEFSAVGAPNFDAYRAARRHKPELAPIPRLLVIVDEYSEFLKSEVGKENLPALESITRVGGGLGVHLLLVTQNFESQLPSQIAANAGLRICFRVQNQADSKAVLSSTEAATIPKERVGRAFMRSHGGRAIEFQAARVAGPRPGKEVLTSPAQARIVPFSTISDPPAEAPIVDVPAEDTDMYAVIEVLNAAVESTGWVGSAIPWPKELPPALTIGEVLNAPGKWTWPVGVVDEPELQRQTIVEWVPYGQHILLIGGPSASLADAVRATMLTGVLKRGPDQLQFYVIDQLSQGLSSLQALPHVGGVAERNDALALRMLRHVASVVSKRKVRLADFGVANLRELHEVSNERMPEIVVVVHGTDRIMLHAESQQSPLLGPLVTLLSESNGTGVRFVVTGPPSVTHHRLGSLIGSRYVFELADPQDFSAVGAPRSLSGGVRVPARAVDVTAGRLMQFALVPSTPEVPASELVRAIGQRLTEQWQGALGELPVSLRDTPWPLPIRQVFNSRPPAGVEQPVALCVNTENGDVAWLDADEDGPSFIVSGPSRSGRSTALLAGATLMSRLGWRVVGIALSRRSPLSTGTFPGELIAVEDIERYVESAQPVALFIDDVHKWTGDTEQLQALMRGPGPRAAVIAGPTEFFGNRSDVVKALPSRCALVLAPRSRRDATSVGVNQLSDEVLADTRAGRGVLVVAGEIISAQVPIVQ